jgi:hypothetical protein
MACCCILRRFHSLLAIQLLLLLWSVPISWWPPRTIPRKISIQLRPRSGALWSVKPTMEAIQSHILIRHLKRVLNPPPSLCANQYFVSSMIPIYVGFVMPLLSQSRSVWEYHSHARYDRGLLLISFGGLWFMIGVFFSLSFGRISEIIKERIAWYLGSDFLFLFLRVPFLPSHHPLVFML